MLESVCEENMCPSEQGARTSLLLMFGFFLTVAVLHTRQIFGPGSVNSNSIDWFFFFFVVLPPPFPLPLPPLMQDHIAYYR